MSRHSILRIVAKFMIPYILLFGLYVQFHGDFGPGGGFQAGVIFAAAFILYSLIFGVQNGRKVLPAWVTRVLLAAGVLIYGGTGVASFFFDANFLSFNVLSSHPRCRSAFGHNTRRIRRGRHRRSHHDYRLLRLCRPGSRVMEFPGLLNYWLVVILMMTGFYIVIAQGNLVKKIVGLNIFQVSVFVFYISVGRVDDGTAPILGDGIEVYSNPLPHVLILTAIVVGVATTALGLAMIVRIRDAYNTIEEDEIQAIEKAESES